METFLLNVAMCTHIGRRRRNNEDAMGYVYPAEPHILAAYGALFVVCDGVGGLALGEQYSEQAISLLSRVYYQTEAETTPERLARAIQAVNAALYNPAQGGAATIVAAVFQQQTLTIASAGDSPAYAFAPRQFAKLTIDHVIDVPDDTKSKKLFRALGYEPALSVDTITGTLQPGMRVALCSDGVTRYWPEHALFELCTTLTPAEAVEHVVRTAYARGGADNITMMLIDVAPPPADGHQLAAHVAALDPVLQLPAMLPEQPPAGSALRRLSLPGSTLADTIVDTAQRRTYHRDDHAVKVAPLRQEPLPAVDAPTDRASGGVFSTLRGFLKRSKEDDRRSAEPEDPQLVISQLAPRPLIIGYLKRLDTTGQYFEIAPIPTLIGRKPSCQVVIANDRGVSGEHGRLEVSAQGYLMLTNISQTNPILVGGTKLMYGEQIRIDEGDVIQVSPTVRLLFQRERPNP